MRIGKLRPRLKAWSDARLSHVSALLPFAIVSPTSNRALADHGHVGQDIMIDPHNQLGGSPRGKPSRSDVLS